MNPASRIRADNEKPAPRPLLAQLPLSAVQTASSPKHAGSMSEIAECRGLRAGIGGDEQQIGEEHQNDDCTGEREREDDDQSRHGNSPRGCGSGKVIDTLWVEKIQSTTDAGSLNTFGRNEIEVAPISSALLRIACLVIL